jgi:hypothetical protein
MAALLRQPRSCPCTAGSQAGHGHGYALLREGLVQTVMRIGSGVGLRLRAQSGRELGLTSRAVSHPSGTRVEGAIRRPCARSGTWVPARNRTSADALQLRPLPRGWTLHLANLKGRSWPKAEGPVPGGDRAKADIAARPVRSISDIARADGLGDEIRISPNSHQRTPLSPA